MFLDPTVDPLNDDRITVSNPFEIIPGGFPIVATNGRNLDKTPRTGLFDHFVALLPKLVSIDKITTLGDVPKLGGKIIAPQYWQ